MASRGGSLAVVAVLVALLVLGVSSEDEPPSPYSLSDFSGVKNPTNEKKLPDLGNAAVRKQLTCSVCRAVVGDFREILSERLEERRKVVFAEEKAQVAGGAKPTPHKALARKARVTELDVAEVTDGFCQRVAKEYNLMTLDNKPDFKNGERRADHGYWVSQFFELRCSELLDEKEEEMVKHFREAPDQFLARICNQCKWKLDAPEHPDTAAVDPSQLKDKIEL